MAFKVSFCHPFKSEIVEYGLIDSDHIMESFDKVPWADLLLKMKDAHQSDIYYSPSFQIENTANNNGLSLSAVDGGQWYIFYKRPKKLKFLFGLIEKMNTEYVTEMDGQSERNVKRCLMALINNDLNFLERNVR